MSQPVRLNSRFGEDLLFWRMEAYEELGRMFQYRLDLLSPSEELELDDLLGTDLTVELDLPKGGTRYFHGFVSEFSQVGRHGDYATYTATVHPWLWFLTQNADCRIYQNMTVPDIIIDNFGRHGFSDYSDALRREDDTYREFEYCVQYRETDFNFVSRLMEQEGIYYFFEHEDGKHTMVLSDSGGSHAALPDYGQIPYFPPTDSARDEHIHEWLTSKSVRSGKSTLRAHDFRKPKAALEVKSDIEHPHAHKSYEVFDYPGEYFEDKEGDQYVKVRMQELACDYERCRGETDARGVFPGGLFELDEFPRKDQNREYLVTQARHSITVGDYASGGGEGFSYKCSFEAIKSDDRFRAPRLTPKPAVQGLQTAVVVGPSGEEIYTDEYGRVRVQFHWDRYGNLDENSSCWVRVAQVWAGTGWGGVTIPRIGQEVIVDFIEGDPDRPIVTGRVYNADNMPPYPLPANATQSGIKSRSSKGASADNFNEVRFEDKMGEEEFYVHAEKDHNTHVENDQTIAVGFDKAAPGDRSLDVNNDERIKIGRDRTQDFGRDKTEVVGRKKTINVGTDHTESIGSNMNITVASNLTESVGINYAETVGAAMELTVGAALAITVGAKMSEAVGGSKSINIGSDKSETIGGNKSVSAGGSFNQSVAKEKKVKVDKDFDEKIGGQHKETVTKEFILNAKKIQLIAQDEVSIKAGKAVITLKKNGDITMKGKKINVKGSGDIIMKGSKIKQN